MNEMSTAPKLAPMPRAGFFERSRVDRSKAPEEAGQTGVLSDEELRQRERREAAVDTRMINDNQFIFRENELGDLAFVVKKGTVEISKTANGKETVLARVGEGGIIGEMALLDNSPRMASAKAVDGPVQLMVISRDLFERKLDGMDPFTKALILIMANHVRNLADTVADLKAPKSRLTGDPEASAAENAKLQMAETKKDTANKENAPQQASA
mgnify:CR=1 FL=1